MHPTGVFSWGSSPLGTGERPSALSPSTSRPIPGFHTIPTTSMTWENSLCPGTSSSTQDSCLYQTAPLPSTSLISHPQQIPSATLAPTFTVPSSIIAPLPPPSEVPQSSQALPRPSLPTSPLPLHPPNTLLLPLLPRQTNPAPPRPKSPRGRAKSKTPRKRDPRIDWFRSPMEISSLHLPTALVQDLTQYLLPPHQVLTGFPQSVCPRDIVLQVQLMTTPVLSNHKIRLLKAFRQFLVVLYQEVRVMSQLHYHLDLWLQHCKRQFKDHSLTYPTIANQWALLTTILGNELDMIRHQEERYFQMQNHLQLQVHQYCNQFS